MTPKKPRDERIPDELIDQLLANYKKPEDLTGESGLIRELTARLLSRALEGEMTEHLGYEKHAVEGRGTANSRNGKRTKKIKGETGEFEVDVPRDRDSTFDPEIIKKRQTRFAGFDEKILALYARGMTVRDIQGHLEEMYGVEVSPSLISSATSAVRDDVIAWQNRPLDSVYAVVFLDALIVKVRDEGVVRNKAVYLAIGITISGTREILGIWIEKTEGAKFWLKVMNELKTRGVEDILIVCCDGLKGFPDAIEHVFPDTTVQTCIVHMIRNSLRFVSYKDRKSVAKDIKPIYTAANREAAESALTAFENKWGRRYEMISSSWRTSWERVVPFLDFPPEVRRLIYTTNQIEAVNSSLRKLLQHRGHFPDDQSVTKLLYLGLRRFDKKWSRTLWNWSSVLGQLAIFFKGRIPSL